MNKVILVGRLTRDPEVRYPQDAERAAVGRFSLAVDRKYKQQGQPEADFFNCTCFGRQAEFAEKYMKKGTKMVITGRIQNDNYTDRAGNKVYSVQVMVEEMEFAESKAAGNQSEKRNWQQSAKINEEGFMNIPDGIDEELPFS